MHAAPTAGFSAAALAAWLAPALAQPRQDVTFVKHHVAIAELALQRNLNTHVTPSGANEVLVPRSAPSSARRKNKAIRR